MKSHPFVAALVSLWTGAGVWAADIYKLDPAHTEVGFAIDHLVINTVRGRFKVSRWKKGVIIRDEHAISLPRTWKAPEAEIYVGLWRGAERMKVAKGPSDGKDRVLAARLPVSAGTATEPRRRYQARKAAAAPVLDGDLSDATWKGLPSTGRFVGSMDGAAAEARTDAKLAWDDGHLYVAFEVEDSDVASTFTRRDDKLWTQDAVEMFIDADGDGKEYVELQVSPAGVVFDSYLPEYRKNEDDWSSGMRVAVKVDGTLNKRDDKDRGWSVEMEIPMAAVKGRSSDAHELPPKLGSSWRVNFFRMDKPVEGPQVATAWSPPKVGDFHALDRFGEVRFVDAEGRAHAEAKPADGVPGAAAGMAGIRKAPAKAPAGKAPPK
jgi:polyisoprenoid-binding protein YceI